MVISDTAHLLGRGEGGGGGGGVRVNDKLNV